MNTKLRFGVIGWPLGHTISPAFQQAALRSLGVDAEYLVAPTPPDELEAQLAAMRRGKWDGLNVTVPHKVATAYLVERLHPAASRLGAVNTLIRSGDHLIGDNTDIEGFSGALQHYGHVDPTDGSSVLLGAGGAARAVAWALIDSGARHLTIANRTLEHAQHLASELASVSNTRIIACGLYDEQLKDSIRRSRLLVNTTTVGMAGGPAPYTSLVSKDYLHKKLCVFDIVYRPAATPLLKAAAAAGCATLGGIEMLVLQGAASLTKWLGQPAPVDVMMDAARMAMATPQSGFGKP